jgi:hypothetical protein
MISPMRAREDSILSQFSRPQTYWLGKIVTYLINAKTNTLIADTLRSYVKTGDYPTGMSEVETRVREFVDSVEGDARHTDQVALTAYVVERVNGLADYLFAHLLTQLLLQHQRRRAEQFIKTQGLHDSALLAYVDDTVSWPAIIAIGSRILLRNHEDIDWYADRYAATLRPTQRELHDTIMLVQHRNIEANATTARDLQTNHDLAPKKVAAIRRAAQETPFPEEFVLAATRTQAAASNWDQLFAWLIALEFRVSVGAR